MCTMIQSIEGASLHEEKITNWAHFLPNNHGRCLIGHFAATPYLCAKGHILLNALQKEGHETRHSVS